MKLLKFKDLLTENKKGKYQSNEDFDKEFKKYLDGLYSGNYPHPYSLLLKKAFPDEYYIAKTEYHKEKYKGKNGLTVYYDGVYIQQSHSIDNVIEDMIEGGFFITSDKTDDELEKLIDLEDLKKTFNHITPSHDYDSFFEYIMWEINTFEDFEKLLIYLNEHGVETVKNIKIVGYDDDLNYIEEEINIE